MRLRDRNWCAVGAASTQVRPADACGASGAAVLGALDYLTYVSGKLKEEPVVAAILGPMNRALPLAIASLLTTSLSAHHGFGTFDRDRTQAHRHDHGLDFVNPHAYVYFERAARTARQAVSAARCAPRRCCAARAGRRDVQRGEPITITGSPRSHRPELLLRHTIVFADGTTADRYAQLTKPAATAAPAARAAARCRPASRTSPATGRPSSSS